MVMLARVLTVVFGALPASVLSVGALLILQVGVAVMWDGAWSGLLVIVWGIAGIYGTISLWAVGFGCDEPGCIAGLAVGVAAISPLVSWVDPDRLLQNGEIDLFAAACLLPFLIGVGWLLAFLIRSKHRWPLEVDRLCFGKHRKH